MASLEKFDAVKDKLQAEQPWSLEWNQMI
jgi:hypothetical protein